MAGSDPVVAVVGLKALSRDMGKLTTDTKGPLFQAMIAAGKTAAEPVAAATRSALPHSARPSPDDGLLVASVRASGTRTGASVRMGSKQVPWAGWVEFGGTRRKPFRSSREYVKDGRYLFPAARGLAETSERLYTDALERVFTSSGVWTNPGDTAHD